MNEVTELGLKWAQMIKSGDYDNSVNFYWDKVFPKVEEKFINENRLSEEPDWLILPSGLEISYYILLIKSLKPKNVYFIGTQEFKDSFLNKILERCLLKPSQYIVDIVEYDQMDVSNVYKKIRDRLDLFYNKKVILDLTRGKRIMAVGAGIVGAFFGFNLVYIDEDWIDEIKRGLPGTERLVTVKNPFEVFGDLEGQEAKELFNNYNYSAALYFYNKLKEKVADPRKIEIEELLSEGYLNWNSFNFKVALYKMDLLLKKSHQYEQKISKNLENNYQVLKILSLINTDNPKNLSKEAYLHMIVDLYANALRKADIGMYDDSISRLYRVLELISQYRLESYGINTSPLEIGNSSIDFKNLQEKYKEITKQIYAFEKEMPYEIGLKDGYIFLFILKDFILKEDSIEDLNKMFGVIRVRDTSIIAHGLQLAGEKAYKNMNQLARKFIDRICKDHNEDFDRLLTYHSFVKL